MSDLIGSSALARFPEVSGGVASDLRASTLAMNREAFRRMLEDGLLERRGMQRFDRLTDDPVQSLFWYVRQHGRIEGDRSRWQLNRR